MIELLYQREAWFQLKYFMTVVTVSLVKVLLKREFVRFISRKGTAASEKEEFISQATVQNS
ncbi:hypothetical protein DPMN_057631 [Dreissena polymorpha]|uniref:Uncharacterized protein n=1 Tax=Dreissena polymorpha TaxID=45954 RepID=A0A9D4C0L4_DREPO|nr:hypothetical protein DPMN_057631 [Dreissena polymorpha]